MDDVKGLRKELEIHRGSANAIYKGKTAIHYAIIYNAERCLQTLLDNGADTRNLDFRDTIRFPTTAIALAIQSGNVNIAKIVLKYPTDIYTPGKPNLYHIFKSDDVKMLKTLVSHDKNVLSYPIRYWSRETDYDDSPDQPVGRAIIMKARKCAEYIIPLVTERETNEEMKKLNIQSAIMASIKTLKDKPLLRVLWTADIAKYLQEPLRNGEGFLHAAAQIQAEGRKLKTQEKIIKLLAINGAPVNMKNANGNTPLHLSSSVRVAKALVNQAASLQIKNNVNQTPAQYVKSNLGARHEDHEDILLLQWMKLKEKQLEEYDQQLEPISDDSAEQTPE